MIGPGLKKYALANGMKVDAGVGYGSLRGYATTLSEGSGYKKLDITTRFPEGGMETFQAAIQSVDVTREYRVQNISMGTRQISVIFTDNPGTMKKLEAFVDWFYPLLAQSGAAGANICTECGAELTAGNWILIDGIAYHLHESCAAKIQEQLTAQETQRKQEDTGTYWGGALGAFLGAALGAVVWAIVLSAGYFASVVGLLIGWLSEKGYTLLKGKQGKGKVFILILAIIFAVLLGTLAGEYLSLVQMVSSGEIADWTVSEVPLLLMALFLTSSEYTLAVLGNVLMGLLFAGLGTFYILKKASQEVSGTKMITLK